MVTPLVTVNARPWVIDTVASVVISGLIPSRVMITPLATPIAIPESTARAIASGALAPWLHADT